METQNMTSQNVQTDVKTMQDINAAYFSPDNLSNAQETIQEVMEICKTANVSPDWNFDPEKESVPDGYGLSVTPITERGKPGEGNQVTGVVIAAIPTVEKLLKDQTGASWIVKQIQSALVRQVKNAVKSRDEGQMSSVPLTINDFVTSARTSAFAGFNEFAGDIVKFLKGKGLKFISKGLLRQVLSSAAFAEQQFSTIPQETWVRIIDTMIAKSKEMQLDISALDNWKRTRDSAEIEPATLDLSGLEDLEHEV